MKTRGHADSEGHPKLERQRVASRLDELIDGYVERCGRSKALFEQAHCSMPGGNTRTGVYFSPFPMYLERGEGVFVHDVDGNELLDFMNNNTALILGHSHPAVVEAVCEQVLRGTGFNRPTELEVEMAEALCGRIPSLEQVRFCNSGTEAVICALRAAKAHTGRSKIAKFEGAYHGSGEYAQISHVPPLGPEIGPGDRPCSVSSSPGVSRGVIDDVVVLPFNDPDACAAIIEGHAGELAALIVDPLSTGAGFTLPRDEFLGRLRALTEEAGIMLVFDEIISLRIRPGGAQEHYGVRPDLTCMGKIIAGGLPGGAFGGRADLMAHFDPLAAPRILQAGTFNANPLTMAAGLATLRLCDENRLGGMEALTRNLESELNAAFFEKGIEAVCTSVGSLFRIHFLTERPMNYREAARDDGLMQQWLFFWLLSEGIHLSQGGALSLPMDEGHVDRLVNSVRKGLQSI